MLFAQPGRLQQLSSRYSTQLITDLLQSNPYVVVIYLDFSKHLIPCDTPPSWQRWQNWIDLPVPVYNWIVAFFEGLTHRTVYYGEESPAISISARIIQGSGIGPASKHFLTDTSHIYWLLSYFQYSLVVICPGLYCRIVVLNLFK